MSRADHGDVVAHGAIVERGLGQWMRRDRRARLSVRSSTRAIDIAALAILVIAALRGLSWA